MFFLRNVTSLVPFVFGRVNVSLNVRKKGNMQILGSLQQLGSSGNRIAFRKSFYNLNFQLKGPHRSNCVSLHIFALRKANMWNNMGVQ